MSYPLLKSKHVWQFLYVNGRNVILHGRIQDFHNIIKSKTFPKRFFSILMCGGVGFGLYSVVKKNSLKEINDSEIKFLDDFYLLEDTSNIYHIKTRDKPTKEINFTLYQYHSCPYSSKVRCVLDYYGYSYNIVEVNPVTSQQIKWSKWKKIPILIIEIENKVLQLSDSSAIVSILSSFRLNPNISLFDICRAYPVISYKNEKGKIITEVTNRYHIVNTDRISDECKWRQWADESLIHSIASNLYKTPREAYQSIKQYAVRGHWDNFFPNWKMSMFLFLSSPAMYLLGLYLKKKYNLKNDVRLSLYDECNEWMKQIHLKNTPYFGGSSPNLADLAVYGILSCMEGCPCLVDVFKNTSISNWYNSVKELINSNKSVLSN